MSPFSFSGTEIRCTYFSSQWQALQERLDDSTDAERQFVWGLRYIDDLVLRDRSVSGTLDERLYALQDANWNVTAIVDSAGDVTERYRYSAYGTPTFLDASFAPETPNESDFDWESLYCGYRYDDDSGLYCVRYRYLHPTVGEWIARDPIGYDGGISLYQYVNGSPELYVDPFGKEGEGCSMCCCCVENLKLLSVIAKNKITLPDPNNAKKTVTSRFDGYEVKVQVDLEYKLDENYSLDCTLKWYEWMTPKPLLPGEPTET